MDSIGAFWKRNKEILHLLDLAISNEPSEPYEKVCLNCDGYGFITRPGKGGIGLDYFGTCDCKKQRDRANVQKHLLDAISGQIAFKINHADLDRGALGVYLKQPPKTSSVLLSGTPGTGKTLAAVWIMKRAVMQDGIRVGFISVRKISESVNGMASDMTGCREYLDFCIRASNEHNLAIILDDLGAEKRSEAATQRVTSIIEALHSRQARCIITTNLTHDEIKAVYGERISSRLRKGEGWITSIKCDTVDHRKQDMLEALN